MFKPIKIVDIDIAKPLIDFVGLENYTALKALIRLNGTPLGFIQTPVINGSCDKSIISKAIVKNYTWQIIRYQINTKLEIPLSLEKPLHTTIFGKNKTLSDINYPLITVAVCTRDRTDDLALCLQAIEKLDYPRIEVLVIDNAPSSEATKRLVEEKFSGFTYICEPRPGLNWARNRAIIESKGEIIAYTDDDVIVDPLWTQAIAQSFSESPDIMAVTGLVAPYEIETEAQQIFEVNGGFGRGFEKKWYKINLKARDRWKYFGAGRYGTGANMAFRRMIFDSIGDFDPALDVGTVTNGGGDLEIFFRVLVEGYTLVYDPAALVWHRHRRNYKQLKSQMTNNGIGFISYIRRSIKHYPHERMAFLRLGWWWLWSWSVKRSLYCVTRKSRIPCDLVTAEFKGSFTGLGRYAKAEFDVNNIEKKYGLPERITKKAKQHRIILSENNDLDAAAVRYIDLAVGINNINDATAYPRIKVFVGCGKYPIGSLDIETNYATLSASRLRMELVNKFGIRLLDPRNTIDDETLWHDLTREIRNIFDLVQQSKEETLAFLPNEYTVSIVIATYDRPDDLRRCLLSLTKLNTCREIEIIIVDNNPSSGLTRSVVEEFGAIVYVEEPRRGLAYARNCGIVASSSDIVVAIDDDVIVPVDWLENLLAPFSRPDIMVVTGNVLPTELENNAQQAFELYGGLGRGFKILEVNRKWFDSFHKTAVPTWKLGATANAAFRSSIFAHPEIGLMDEALGAGMPSGCSEDTYLFYKVLKAGYTIFYNPSAYVWHKHRNTKAAFRKQIYNYSKGHVAYHLTTAIRDKDLRGYYRIFIELPKWRIKQLYRYLKCLLRGRKRYPLVLIFIEIWGNLVGPFSLWQSRRRVAREGRSPEYVARVKTENSYKAFDNI